jgi:hypothetical protein
MEQQGQTNGPPAQSTLLADRASDEIPPRPKALDLPTPREYNLVRLALEHLLPEFERLAKSEQAMERYGAARETKAAVETIRDFLLPQVKERQMMLLTGPDEIRAALAELVRDPVTRGRKGRQNEEQLMEAIALRIEPFAHRVFDAGFALGLALREQTSDAAIIRAAVNTRLGN